jgi:DNA-binding Lrp family transcriptional regulator
VIEVEDMDHRLLARLADGLPLASRPYAEIGRELDLSEDAVIGRIRRLAEGGVIRRFGLIVRHHELGYQANAMSVWDVPDDQVDALGTDLAAYPFVTLCYRRRRQLPRWPYNLFAMVHGKERSQVQSQVEQLNEQLALGHLPHHVLFSTKRYKQSAARFAGALSKAG